MRSSACPQCGGPPGRQLPWIDIRQCPGAIALLAGGRVVAHMAAAEAGRVAGEIVLLLAADLPGLTEAAEAEAAGAA
jgi:hypothetical protein